MTDRELMQQALDALNHVNVQDRVQTIAALRERLAREDALDHMGEGHIQIKVARIKE